MSGAGRPKSFEATRVRTINTHSKYSGVWKWAETQARQEGLSLSEFIEHCMKDVMTIKKEGNPQVQLLHITNEPQSLSKTIQAKFMLRDLNSSLKKLQDLKKQGDKKSVHQWNFHMNNLRKLLPKAETLSKSVFPKRFEKIFVEINAIIQA